MKRYMFLGTMVLLCGMLTACVSDDVDAILDSGTWNLGNFYGANNWDKINDNGRVVYTEEADLKVIAQLDVTFSADGTLQGHYVGGTFTAHWEADGKQRTISITQLKITGTPDGLSKKFVESLTQAAYYKGDSNYLKLAPADKNSYMQFAHYAQGKNK